ncbi:MAG TPA: hypothetical protein VMF89_36690 [Polyangiales bacterium]|nr:hypothetical protein [Polyangiales bacterium]
MFYLFLLVLAVLGVGIYLLFFLQNVPGAVEERLGALEPLPPDLGEWQEDTSTEAGQARAQGLQREVRWFLDESSIPGRLLRQARYRDLASNEIVRADPDQVVKRKRLPRS